VERYEGACDVMPFADERETDPADDEQPGTLAERRHEADDESEGEGELEDEVGRVTRRQSAERAERRHDDGVVAHARQRLVGEMREIQDQHRGHDDGQA